MERTDTQQFDNHEKKNGKLKNAFLIFVGGTALTAMVLTGSGCGGNNVSAENQPKPTPTEAPSQPGISTSESSPEQQKVPKEAEVFVESFGNRYEDPVAVYFAEKAYEAEMAQTGQIAVVADDFINNAESYKAKGVDLGKMLGYGYYELPKSAEYDQPTFVDVYNNYIAPQLSIYMNEIAKNPTDAARELIDNEFLDYHSANGNSGSPAEFTVDNQYIDDLMNFAQEIVAKYGPNANYTVEPAYIMGSEPDNWKGSLFAHGEEVSAVENLGKINSQTDIIMMATTCTEFVVKVNQFDNAGQESTTNDVSENIKLTIMRQPGRNDTSSTLISIGIQSQL